MGISKELAPTAALTAGAAFVSLANTAIRDHRVHTHRSLEFNNDSVERAARVVGGHLTDTKRWAAVHRVHHSTPDANLEPFVELADYIDWRSRPGSETSEHPELPDEVRGYDPAVEAINLDTAYEIGCLARELVGGLYQPAEHYSPIAGVQLLESGWPRYFYEDKKQMKHDRKNPVRFDPENKPSLRQIRFLLRDPHSPALHTLGIPGILRDNVPNYGYAENNFEDPAFRSKDLLPDATDTWIRENRGSLRYAYAGGMALAGVLLGHDKAPSKIARNAVLGAAASGLAVVTLIGGGNSTNAFGHAGVPGSEDKRQALSDLIHGKVYPKPDGTYTTDGSWWLSLLTLDEVGGQEVHHDHPDKIAYSLKNGGAKLIEATFGSSLEFLARHGIIFKPGDNFDGRDQRPDLPSEAVLKLQDYRAKKLAEAS